MNAMNAQFVFAGIIGVALIITGIGISSTQLPAPLDPQVSGVQSFTSLDQIKAHVKNSQALGGFYGGLAIESQVALSTRTSLDALSEGAAQGAPVGGAQKTFSTTNVQVQGVDEADIVKTDGDYVYIASEKNVFLVDATPPSDARIVSTITLDSPVSEIFVNKDRLIIFSVSYQNLQAEGRLIAEPFILPSYNEQSHIFVYDISDKENPEQVRDISVDGTYFDSRMIGDYVYAIIDASVYGDGIALPEITDNKESVGDTFPVYYIDNHDVTHRFSTIVSLNVHTNDKPDTNRYLLGYTQNLYVSKDNIYITYQKNIPPQAVSRTLYEDVYTDIYPDAVTQEIQRIESSGVDEFEKFNQVSKTIEEYRDSISSDERANLDEKLIEKEQEFYAKLAKETDKTIIHRIAIDNGKVEHKAVGEVPGKPLNQFSMDEYDGHFRIATTTDGGFFVRGQQDQSKNHVYVTDLDLTIVGKVEDLAPGERIFSSRFMGDRLYLVTFVQVDPLFVIDLSDHTNPTVLGELKIPGVSDYLHPYDENHIIGIGKDAVSVDESGRQFALFQGVKLSLFDVSDVKNPKEVATFRIGDRGTDSEALRDHKAFLFDREKNLLVLPILLAEIQGKNKPDPFDYGDYTWQGAYVFRLDTEDGFTLRGKITHQTEKDKSDSSGYYYYSPYSVKRSLFIGDTLYTLSPSRLVMNSLEDLKAVGDLELPYEGEYFGPGGAIPELFTLDSRGI